MTGGQRLHRYADYIAALAARGMSTAPLVQYLAAFEHACHRTAASRSD